jgi:transcription antitermination factor NusG
MKRQDWCILLVRTGFEQIIKDQFLSKKDEYQIEDIACSNEFPGYLFIKSEIVDSSFLEIENTIKLLGRTRCVVNGKKVVRAQRFSNSEINKLSLIRIETKRHINIEIGDNVIVRKGDLADISGKVIEIKKRIVKIKPDLFHKIIKVRVQDVEII